jgi:hypothetical protein
MFIGVSFAKTSLISPASEDLVINKKQKKHFMMGNWDII